MSLLWSNAEVFQAVLPEVPTTLLFDGLKPDEKAYYGQEEGSEDDYA
jgi:hypothetical protein